ncbi:MAG TPA: MFS transporter [Candidatus Limnocylindria bacterium]|jgi:MFS family permease
MDAAPPRTPAELPGESSRRAVLATYVAAAALTSTAYIAVFQNASVAAPAMTGTATTAGLPSSAGVAGTAAAAALLASLMATRGRRAGIALGIGVALVGGLITVAAILVSSFLLLVAGALLTGFGNAAIALSRYAAADLYPDARRGGVVGVVVWGSTIGAVLGPNLVAPANALGMDADLPRFAGAFLASAALFLLGAAVALFGPSAPATRTQDADTGPRLPMRRLLADLLATPIGRTAVIALVSGQAVMVLVMTMTPYELDHRGHGEVVIGLVISAHVLGMFALAPISGRLVDRLGAVRVMLAGFATLTFAGLLAAAMSGSIGTSLAIPLFLLGFGWNLSFVAGSALLASGGHYANRARLQGVVDAFVWGTSALAGVVAGLVVAWLGFAVLALMGAAVAVVMAATLALRAGRHEPVTAG